MQALMNAITAQKGGRGGSAGAPLRLVANNTRVGAGMNAAVAAGAVKIAARSRHVLGAGGATEILPVYAGYAMSTGSPPAETPFGNAVAVGASMEVPGAPGVGVFTFAFDGPMASGAAEHKPAAAARPEDFGFAGAFPAGMLFYIVTEYEVAPGENLPQDAYVDETLFDEISVAGPAGAPSKVGTTGQLAASDGWAASFDRPRPIAIVGRAAAPQASVAVMGDSIAMGEGDAIRDGIGNTGGGFARRGLSGVGGHVVPHTILARSAERAQGFAAAGQKRHAILKYASHALCQHGTNDMSVDGRAPVQVRESQRAIWALCKTAGVGRVEQMLMFPKATGPWTSAGAQAAVSRAELDAVNANILADVGTNGLDAAIDHGIGDAGDPRLWKSDGGTARTGDGVHPNPTGHDEAADVVAARAAAWVAE